MIRRYVIALSASDGIQLGHSDAYAMYAALLDSLGGDVAERLHGAEDCSISQYIVRLNGRAESLWTVNLAGAEAVGRVSNVIESMKRAELRALGATVSLEVISKLDVENLSDLMKTPGDDMDCSRFLLSFLSPCGFRSNGEYAVFPSVPLILGSLCRRWNAAFPFSPVEDGDALSMLAANVKITGYRLRGSSFKLKGVSIPAFSGTATLSARLAPPLLQLLRALLSFGAFSGVGIKTTLGMGALDVKESQRRRNVPPSADLQE